VSIVSIDFETRSRTDLKKCGAYVYSRCPSTEVLCTAFAVDDQKVDCFEGFPKEVVELSKYPEFKFSAFNAGFEKAIWDNVTGAVEIPAHRWIDTAAISASHSLPRQMGDVAEALSLPILKDEEGKAIMMKMCKPDSNGNWVYDEEKLATLMAYCHDDVEVEREILKRLGHLSPTEQKVWELDLKINTKGIRIDKDLARAIIDMKEPVKKELTTRCRSSYGFGPGQVAKIKEFLRENDVEVPTKMSWKKVKGQEAKVQVRVETLESKAIKALLVQPIPESCKDVLRMRKMFATTSLAKADSVLNQTVGDVAHYQFMYHGANTGRWSGKGIQLHNLPRGEFDEDFASEEMSLACKEIKAGKLESFDMEPMDVLRSALRGMVIPREGKSLTVVDFAQIEARVLPWLAGQQDVLDAFEQGKDLYKFTASQIYKKPYESIIKSERNIGKIASLALGFGGGQRAFNGMAANYGLHMTPTEADVIKNDWRARNPEIVQFWYNLEGAARRTLHSGNNTKVGFIKFKKEGGFLVCTLPSGRQIKYFDPFLKQSDRGKQVVYFKGTDQARGINWGDVSTYGGRLAENVTQAVARDILAEAMVRLDKFSWIDIVGHVHDEVILEIETKKALANYKLIEKCIVHQPTWATGLPIGADGFIGPRYRK